MRKIQKHHILNLKRRIIAAVFLVTALPLLVIVAYFFRSNIIFTEKQIFILGVIIFVGWVVILDFLLLSVRRIYLLSRSALEEVANRGISEEISSRNEIEGIESIFSLLTSRLKSSFQELQQVSKKIDDLNQEISKKVGVLSTIMEIHTMFSGKESDEEVLQFIVYKIKEVLHLERVIFLLHKDAGGEKFTIFPYQREEKLSLLFNEKYFSKIKKLKNIFVSDFSREKGDCAFFQEPLQLKNFFLNPIYIKGELMGICAGGNNRDNFTFSSEDINLIELFSKNIIMLWEHRRLSSMIEEMGILDPLTGLYEKEYFFEKMEEEIKRTSLSQKPCGFIIAEISNFRHLLDTAGVMATEHILWQLASTIKQNLRQLDIACRLAEDQLAIILKETNHNQCHRKAKELRNIVDNCFKGKKDKPQVRFSVAEIPLDGILRDEIISVALSRLKENV